MADLATPAREATEAREYVRARPGEEILLIEATMKLGPCHVRSNTEHPCPHQAVTEIWGIPFCEPCAREQEAYFAIGKLTTQPQGLASDLELAGRIAEAGKR
jgi:CspA family cold shock protein